MQDLSYSNIVKELQGDQQKGVSLIKDIAFLIEKENKNIEQLEIDLACAKGRKDTYIQGCLRVLQHLNKQLPISIEGGGYIITVDAYSVSINRNIL